MTINDLVLFIFILELHNVTSVVWKSGSMLMLKFGELKYIMRETIKHSLAIEVSLSI